jgi:transglutaminase-like putative cysteine protease
MSRLGAAVTTSLGRVEPVVGALVTIAAGLSFGWFYGSVGWLPALAGAVVLGTAVGVVSAVRRWRWWLTVPAALLSFLLYALYVCYPTLTSYGVPGRAAVRALGDGLTSGVAKMLTVALPADVTGDLLVTPLALAFVAGLAVALLALRTTAVTVLALPPLLLFVAGLLVSVERPQPRLLATGVAMLAMLFLLLLRANRVSAADREGIAEQDAAAVGLDLAAQRWHSTLGRVAFGLPVIALVSALGVAGAWALPIADGSDRFDPRNLRDQHFRMAAGLTPLVEVKPQLEGSPSPLFSVRVSQRGGSAVVDRVRVATLDSFDGALWTQSRDFVVAGSTLPKGPALGKPVVTVNLDVDVIRLPQPFLPVVGRPVRVSAQDVAFDTRNGTLVSTRPEVAGYRYRVTGEVRPLDDALYRARVPANTAHSAFTELPDKPGWVDVVADEITREQQTPYTQLTAIQEHLRAHGYALAARPGHSYGALDRILRDPDPAERVGYAEQFASAFAVLARAKGYPARVAVGYRLLPENLVGDRYQVRSTDAHAWPEVQLAGFGWVPFEPTDTGNTAVSKPPRDTTAPLLPKQATQVREPEPDVSNEGGQPVGSGVASGIRRALLVAVGVVVFLVLLLALVVTAKALRRRRRSLRGTPSERVAAAWRETTDRLRERGTPVPLAQTPVEIGRNATAGPVAPVAPQLGELALIVTTAVCAPDEPPDEAATRSWELEAEIRRSLNGSTPLLLRVRALLDPRPLLPRRIRPAGAGRVQSIAWSRGSSEQRHRAPVAGGGVR